MSAEEVEHADVNTSKFQTLEDFHSKPTFRTPWRENTVRSRSERTGVLIFLDKGLCTLDAIPGSHASNLNL
jgi:hypothetical protein